MIQIKILPSPKVKTFKKIEVYPIKNTQYNIPLANIQGKEQGKTRLVSLAFDSSWNTTIDFFQKLVEEINPENIQGKLFLTPYLNKYNHLNQNELMKYKRVFPNINFSDFEVTTFFDAVFLEKIDEYLDFHIDDFLQVV